MIILMTYTAGIRQQKLYKPTTTYSCVVDYTVHDIIYRLRSGIGLNEQLSIL